MRIIDGFSAHEVTLAETIEFTTHHTFGRCLMFVYSGNRQKFIRLEDRLFELIESNFEAFIDLLGELDDEWPSITLSDLLERAEEEWD